MSDIQTRFLDRSELVAKCHIGEGNRCCRYLVIGVGGFECAATLGPSAVAMLDERVEKMTARSGPCDDPFDSTSEAKPWQAA